jgi:hypothetical protein
MIFWSGSASDTTCLARSCDQDWTQDIDGRGDLGYSRLLLVASPKRILQDNPAPDVASAMHDGIEDTFAEKGSRIYYLKKGLWLDLQGAD